MIKGDNAEAARRMSDDFKDVRVSHAWDPDRALAEQIGKSLNLKKTPWDIYLLYGPGTRWEGETLPPPSRWMAQLTADYGIDENSLLDPGRFAQEVLHLLGKKDGVPLVDRKLSFHTRGVLETQQKGREFHTFMQEVKSPPTGQQCQDSCT